MKFQKEPPARSWIRTEEKVETLVGALREAPGSMTDLMNRTGLTPTQFKTAWSHIKTEYASDHGLIAVYEPQTNRYGLWPASIEAFNGGTNRVSDVLTRLSTIERSIFDGLLAHGAVTARLYRALVMARDEYAEMGEKLLDRIEMDART